MRSVDGRVDGRVVGGRRVWWWWRWHFLSVILVRSVGRRGIGEEGAVMGVETFAGDVGEGRWLNSGSCPPPKKRK